MTKFFIILPIIIFIIFLIKNIITSKKDKTTEPKEPTELQKRFESFSPEIKWTITKPFLDIFGSAVSNKMAVLPSLSAISVAMVVVATLNPELVPITLFQSKIIISILLFFIPACLIIYILDVQEEAERALKHYESYTGVNPKKGIKSGVWDYIKGTSPLFVAVIYLSIIIFILEIIWGVF